jgi:hypothetical protein
LLNGGFPGNNVLAPVATAAVAAALLAWLLLPGINGLAAPGNCDLYASAEPRPAPAVLVFFLPVLASTAAV